MAYQNIALQTIATLEEQIKLVDEGLVEVEKGQLEAALGFAEASFQISLGELQMELANAQLDSRFFRTSSIWASLPFIWEIISLSMYSCFSCSMSFLACSPNAGSPPETLEENSCL